MRPLSVLVMISSFVLHDARQQIRAKSMKRTNRVTLSGRMNNDANAGEVGRSMTNGLLLSQCPKPQFAGLDSNS